MPTTFPFNTIIPRFPRLHLFWALIREAGWRHLASLVACSGLRSVLDIAGLGVGVTLLLGSGSTETPKFPLQLTLQQGLVVLIVVMLLRGALQALVAIRQERLRSGFTDRLREQLLALVLQASSLQLETIGRGDLLGLLMADIGRSVLALDQGVRSLQALLSLIFYAAGVLVVGKTAAIPLLLALAATGAAALLQRSGSWQLGRLQTHLNGALQRTVGDGLHGLKAVRAAVAEDWLLQRFTQDSARFRRVLQQTVQRQALFITWRDTLVVLVVGSWLLWSRSDLGPAVMATTLLLAYRMAASLSAVINAQRLCLGSLPGYEELCKRRMLLQPANQQKVGKTPRPISNKPLKPETGWMSLEWQPSQKSSAEPLFLKAGQLVAVVGPSGSGKTTLLDQFCGLLNESHSTWLIKTEHNTMHWSGVEGARCLRSGLAYAPQDAVLFEASLRHNLLLNENKSSDELKGWLERLGLAHLLLRQEGLDEPLSLAMDPFSGGEIHRLGLLRAWLRDCPVEVLDEPTAFLDKTSAQMVRQIICERMKKRLVLVSTHDQELIKLADRVVILNAPNDVSAVRHYPES